MKIPKFLILIFGIFLFLFSSNHTFAAQNSFVTIVNPVRGSDFWELFDKQNPSDSVIKQFEIAREFNVPMTWLIRYDVFKDQNLISIFKSIPQSYEKGLFLEITPTLTNAAGVTYHPSEYWYLPQSVFLTGYTQEERVKLIDTAFEEFRKVFGAYPTSVGAWWIDSYSLDYMQKKYGISAALIVADQHSTDHYQVWGQYWSAPYYPSQKNTIIPAQLSGSKIPVVVMQWASRDPVNGYGKSVFESTYSLQANDYIDYHDLDIQYFTHLIDIFTKQPLNQVNQVVVGIENSYSWEQYGKEYRNQIEVLSQKQKEGQLQLTTMRDFASWYKNRFEISPAHIIVADDPLGTGKKAVWYMNPYYRTGWFYSSEGSLFRDIRQYINGETEPCYDKPCSFLNSATFPTRVLDEITYGHKWIIDEGSLQNFRVTIDGNAFVINYLNSAGNQRKIVFHPRDIEIDSKISSIDGAILDALTLWSERENKASGEAFDYQPNYRQIALSLGLNYLKFLLFICIGFFIPGFLLVKNLKHKSIVFTLFLSLCTGIVLLTLLSFLAGYFNAFFTVPIVGVFLSFLFWFKKFYLHIFQKISLKFNIFKVCVIFVILLGSIFQSLSMFRSGFPYTFGWGFFGPTGHDGVWHQALAEQIIKNIPPQVPGLSGVVLTNYHYFYDLLIASTAKLTAIPVDDLIYRMYPLLFSILLGTGSYLLINYLFLDFKDKLLGKVSLIITLYFVYFGSSFGWIVEYLRDKHFGGESTFWVNQPVSFNLNPPFAISLILLIATLLICNEFIQSKSKTSGLMLLLTGGTLIEFKVYAGIIFLIGFALYSLQRFILNKQKLFLLLSFSTGLFSALLFFPQNTQAASMLSFQPFWFIHAMIDSPDRVGWVQLTQARAAYFNRGEWIKYILAEGLGLAIFLLGNLGTRFVALFSFLFALKQKLLQNYLTAIIFWMSIPAVVIPLIFIQIGNPWNTIQFFYYFLYFITLFVGVSLVFLFRILPKFIAVFLIIVVCLITPISSVATFKGGLSDISPAKLSADEYKALRFLKTLPDGVVLTYPYDNTLKDRFEAPYPLFAYETTAYVSAFSAKPTFIEGEIQQKILGYDYKKRVIASKEFFSGRDIEWSKKFLKDNNIRYIYVPNIYKYSPNLDNLKTIFENDEVKIYEVLH